MPQYATASAVAVDAGLHRQSTPIFAHTLMLTTLGLDIDNTRSPF